MANQNKSAKNTAKKTRVRPTTKSVNKPARAGGARQPLRDGAAAVNATSSMRASTAAEIDDIDGARHRFAIMFCTKLLAVRGDADDVRGERTVEEIA